MADNEKTESVLAELTAEEQQVLIKTLKRVESDIFQKLVKRLTVIVITIAALFTVGGLISWSSCSTNVEKATVDKLVSDKEIRENIVNKSQERMSALSKQQSEDEKEAAKILESLNEDLKQLRIMLQRVNVESQNPANKVNEKK